MGNDEDAARALSREEALRQAEVFASGALGMRGNKILHSVVSRAAEMAQTSIAAISIIDRDRQWFAAFVGPLDEETEREASFCAHAILHPSETFCVPDAARDPRFSDNRLVTDAPHIRFYAGIPIVNHNGAALGALCAIDPEARDGLLPEQDAALRELAEEAVREIDRIENLRRYAVDAILQIVPQISEAARNDDETLLLALDQILQAVETEIQSDWRN